MRWLHWNCNLREASVRIFPDQSLINPYKNRTIIVFNVNTYSFVLDFGCNKATHVVVVVVRALLLSYILVYIFVPGVVRTLLVIYLRRVCVYRTLWWRNLRVLWSQLCYQPCPLSCLSTTITLNHARVAKYYQHLTHFLIKFSLKGSSVKQVSHPTCHSGPSNMYKLIRTMWYFYLHKFSRFWTSGTLTLVIEGSLLMALT